MKQLLQDFRSHHVRLEEVPAPCCRAGGVLVRNATSLISSGTERATVALGAKSLVGMGLERPDLVQSLIRRVRTAGIAEAAAAVRAKLDAGVALGYSSAGEVLEVGAGAEEFAVGERVASAGADYASHAEVNWVPKNLCVRIPGGVDFEAAASVAVGGIALHAVRVAEVKLGERVAVVGLGLVGLLAAQVLKAAGCWVWGIDLDPDRVRLGRDLGLDFACESRAWRESPWYASSERGEGPDAVIVAAATRSTEPIELAGRLARDRGIVVVVGDVRVDIPREFYYKKELQVRYSRSYGPGRYDAGYEERGIDYPYGFVRWTEKRNMEAFLALVEAGKVRVSPLVTHRFAISDALSAYDLLSGKRREKYLGILITYPSQASASKRVALHLPLKPRGEWPVASGKPGITRHSPLATGHLPLRVGWIGAGSFSKAKLLPALRKISGVEFGGLANSTGISAKKAAGRFGFRYCSTDAAEILSDQSLDAVFIATPHHLHAPLVIAALKQGKHVFVEKPLCVSEVELDQIAEAYGAAGRILAVGFNRRFSPFARECKEFFEGRSGPLSVLYRINAGRLPPAHWTNDPEQGHGRVIGEVCHFVDLLQYLTGSLPSEVRAVALDAEGRADPSSTFEGGPAEDNIHIQIGFADGSRGEILYLSSGDTSVPKERVEVFGGGRTAVSEDFRKSWFYRNNRCRARRLWRQDKGHRAELEAFVQAVKSNGGPPVSFDSLYATTLATFRIRESLARGAELPVFPPEENGGK